MWAKLRDNVINEKEVRSPVRSSFSPQEVLNQEVPKYNSSHLIMFSEKKRRKVEGGLHGKYFPPAIYTSTRARLAKDRHTRRELKLLNPSRRSCVELVLRRMGSASRGSCREKNVLFVVGVHENFES